MPGDYRLAVRYSCTFKRDRWTLLQRRFPRNRASVYLIAEELGRQYSLGYYPVKA